MALVISVKLSMRVSARSRSVSQRSPVCADPQRADDPLMVAVVDRRARTSMHAPLAGLVHEAPIELRARIAALVGPSSVELRQRVRLREQARPSGVATASRSPGCRNCAR